MAVKLPKSVKIGPFTYRIVAMTPTEVRRESCSGATEHGKGLIRIRADGVRDQIAETIIHEIGHGIYWTMNVREGDNEERVVRQFSTGWAAVVRDNPILMKWLAAHLRA